MPARTITGKASTVRIHKKDGKQVVTKRNNHSRRGFAQREYDTIREVGALLKRHGLSTSSYKAVGATEHTLTTEFVDGETLEHVLRHGPRTVLAKKLTTLGRVMRLVQEHYAKRWSGPATSTTRRIFASGMTNYIVTRQAIVPIDLGSTAATEPALRQVGRFLAYVALACIRPWQRPPGRERKRLVEAFLTGYFGTKPGPAEHRSLLPLVLDEYQRLLRRALRLEWGLKSLPLALFCIREQHRLIPALRAAEQEVLTRFAKLLGQKLRWAFYKSDICNPHLAKDIDVLCAEPGSRAAPALEGLGLTREGERTFWMDGRALHFHYNGRTNTRLLFLWDPGPLILATRRRTKEGWYRPRLPAWLFVRWLFMMKKPRKWLRKQFKRLLAPGRV